MYLLSMTEYETDSRLISWICFHSGYDTKRINIEVAIVEQRMSNMEQRELDGENTGYYA